MVFHVNINQGEKMKKLTRNSASLLACVTLDSITVIFIYTSLLSFILDVSNDNIINVAIFYLVLHVSAIALSWLIAPLFKKFSKVIALRIGIMFKFIFVLIVVFFKDSIVNYVYLIAICDAFAEILFWCGVNTLQPLVTKNSSLSTFISISKILGTIINIVVPIFMGYLIDKIGIHIISITMIFVVVAQIVFSMLIKQKDEELNTKLNYKGYAKKLKENCPQSKRLFVNLFLYGICSNVTMLILYFTVITFGSNLSLGIFSMLASIMAIIVVAIYNVKKRWFNNRITAITSSILIAFSIIFIMFNLNKVSLILFYVFWHISIIVPEITTSSIRFNIVQQPSLEKFNIENLTVSETYLDAGRVVGEILLVLMGVLNNNIFNICVLSFITIIIVIYLINTVKLRKKWK